MPEGFQANRLDTVIASESIGFIAGEQWRRPSRVTGLASGESLISYRLCPAHEAVGLGRHLPRGGVSNVAGLRISPKLNG